MKRKKRKGKEDGPVLLPPTAFSNAMNNLWPDFDFRCWPDSREWRLFNAGRAAAAEHLAAEANELRQSAKIQSMWPDGERWQV